jgi:hypothetical protein
VLPFSANWRCYPGNISQKEFDRAKAADYIIQVLQPEWQAPTRDASRVGTADTPFESCNGAGRIGNGQGAG